MHDQNFLLSRTEIKRNATMNSKNDEKKEDPNLKSLNK